jgi:SH3-like domain-containing protein
MTSTRTILLAAIAALVTVLLVGFSSPQKAYAQTKAPPYWASLRYDETRMRVGPSREYPIDWIYRRKGLPLKVIRTRDEWDLVEDPDGTQGWIAESQLRRTRTAMVTGEGEVALREQPDAGSTLRWNAEPGVIGALLRCREGWCEIDVAGRTGWVNAERLWGDEELSASE